MVGLEPRILLVDDDELSRRMMGLLLSEKGYNYDTASNGLEAVESVQTKLYDIVLMDLQMPLMDGFDATRKIREWEAEEDHVPIVALTAMLFENEIQECLRVGMDECVAKPFDTETLFRLIDSYVNKANLPIKKNESHDTEKAKRLLVLDVQGALPRFSEDLRIYHDFLEEFINELPARIEQFRGAFLAGDFSVLADSAHNLKGISASLGAAKLSSLAQVLDQKSQSEDSLLIQQTLNDIEKHVYILQDEVNNLLSGNMNNGKA